MNTKCSSPHFLLSLLLIALLPLASNAATVSFNFSTGNFTTRTQNTGLGVNNDPFAGTYNPGGSTSDVSLYANSTWGPEVAVAAFRTLTDAASGGSSRALQTGDVFTVTANVGSNPNSQGSIGISFNDGTASSSYSDYSSGWQSQFVIYDAGAWKVNSNSGLSEATGLGSGSDRTFTIKITSDRTFNATIGNQNFYDLAFNGGAAATIDSFAVWSTVGGGGNAWKTDNPDSTWKSGSVQNTGTVELGYAAGSGVTRSFSGVIADGLAADSTSTSSANSVYVGGDAGSQVNVSGNNTYTGTTTVNANATLEAQHANAMGSTSSGTSVTSGGALKLYSATATSYASEALTLNGTGVSGANGALRNVGGTNTWNGAISLGSNARINADTTGGAGSLTVAGISGGSNVLFIGANGANISIAGVLSGAGSTQDGTTTSLFKDGSGTLTLSGNNSYSGDTRVTAGVVNVASGGDLGDGTSDVYVSSGATLNVDANTEVASIQEAGNSNGGSASIGVGASLTVSGGDYNTYMNSIGGSGNLVKSGSGTMNLYGTQSYSGTTAVSGGKLSTSVALATAGVTISGGTFVTTAADVLGNTAAVTVNGGTYSVGGSDTVGVLSGSGGTVDITTNTATLTTSFHAAANNYAGAITGTGGFAKAGTGTLTLSGANTKSGANTVAGGKLEVQSGGSLAGATTVTNATLDVDGTLSGSVIVNGGGTIMGSGSVGALTINGILSPGNSPGTLNATSATWSNVGSYDWEIYDLSGGAGIGWDLLSVDPGTLDLSGITTAGGFTINLITLSGPTTQGNLANFVPSTGYSWLIAKATGISGFQIGDFSLNTSAFANAYTGTFGLEVGSAGAGYDGLFPVSYTHLTLPTKA